jgi:hypothetical protein
MLANPPPVIPAACTSRVAEGRFSAMLHIQSNGHAALHAFMPGVSVTLNLAPAELTALRDLLNGGVA